MSALAEIGLRRGEEEAHVVKKKHLGISRADKLMAFQSNRRDGDIQAKFIQEISVIRQSELQQVQETDPLSACPIEFLSTYFGHSVLTRRVIAEQADNLREETTIDLLLRSTLHKRTIVCIKDISFSSAYSFSKTVHDNSL